MKNILVAIDGSAHGEKALEKAKELGMAMESVVNIVYVISCLRNCHPYALDLHYEAEINRVLLDQAKEILKEAEEKFKDYEGQVKTFIRCGDPEKEIIDKAKLQKCDLVIMGSRGLNKLSRTMLGSVSNKVLNNIDISVLIVK